MSFQQLPLRILVSLLLPLTVPVPHADSFFNAMIPALHLIGFDAEHPVFAFPSLPRMRSETPCHSPEMNRASNLQKSNLLIEWRKPSKEVEDVQHKTCTE